MDKNASIVSTLESYKTLTEMPNNQKSLLKDKTIILYVSTLLESKNYDVLSLCLDILEIFVRNEKSHDALLSTFGTFEALESLSIRLRHSDYSSLAERAKKVTDVLRNSAPPAYSIRHRRKGNTSRKTTFIYLLHIEELTVDNRIQLDEALLQINGIISFVIDLEQKRCTVRTTSKLSINCVVSKIKEACGMLPYLVSRNANEEEVLIDILSKSCANTLYPEYIPEEESAPKGNAIKVRTNSPKNSSNWLKAASNFWSDNFYW